MGTEVVVEELTRSFGTQTIWSDVTLTLPPGEISVLLGPSGAGKSVFLKSIVGLLKPERGRILIHGTDVVTCRESRLYEIRKLFGVLFQDGAVFGSTTRPPPARSSARGPGASRPCCRTTTPGWTPTSRPPAT